MKKLFLTLLFSAHTFGGSLVFGSSPNGSTGVSTNSLIASWKMDEASGTRVDYMAGGALGASHSLTDNNTTTSAAGKIGNAAHLVKGSAQFLSRANEADFQVGSNQSFAWEFFVNMPILASASGALNVLVAKDTAFNGNSDEYYVLVNNADNKVYFVVGNGAGFAQIVSTTTIAASTWYHIVCEYDSSAGKIKLWINGASDATEQPCTGTQSTSANLEIGCGILTGSPTFYSNADIDLLRFWKRTIDSDVSALYNSGNGLTLP